MNGCKLSQYTCQLEPHRIPDLMGYQILPIDASNEYRNNGWHTTGTSGNKLAFTGQDKAICCRHCFSLFYLSQECNLLPTLHTVTATCAHIKLINNPDAELITVSLQRLSCCRSQDIGTVTPWTGHGQTRKRRQLRKQKSLESEEPPATTGSSLDLQESKRTRRGRMINKPKRYCLINQLPQGSACQQGGGCKAGLHETEDT